MVGARRTEKDLESIEVVAIQMKTTTQIIVLKMLISLLHKFLELIILTY